MKEIRIPGSMEDYPSNAELAELASLGIQEGDHKDSSTNPEVAPSNEMQEQVFPTDHSVDQPEVDPDADLEGGPTAPTAKEAEQATEQERLFSDQ